MRTLPCCLFFVFCFSAIAQDTNEVINPNTNRLVKFYADNLPYVGVTKYPSMIEDTSLSNVPAGWNTNFIGGIGFAEHVEAIRVSAAWINGKSNALWVAANKRTLNLNKIAALFDLLPPGWTNCAQDKITSDIIEGSLASGTNTQAQIVVRIRQLNGITQNAINRQQKVLELWWRMESVLRAMYDPIKDKSP